MIVERSELESLRLRLLAVAAVGDADTANLALKKMMGERCLAVADSIKELLVLFDDDPNGRAIADTHAVANALQLLAHQPAKGKRQRRAKARKR